jgi:hypothetical protein
MRGWRRGIEGLNFDRRDAETQRIQEVENTKRTQEAENAIGFVKEYGGEGLGLVDAAA